MVALIPSLRIAGIIAIWTVGQPIMLRKTEDSPEFSVSAAAVTPLVTAAQIAKRKKEVRPRNLVVGSDMRSFAGCS